MLRVLRGAGGALEEIDMANPPPADSLVWIDLHGPTTEEERWVERLLNIEVPTRQEMAEIEESARLYTDKDAVVLTTVLIEGFGEHRPARTQVTFVLTAGHLVTVRYADPVPFRTGASKLQRQSEPRSAQAILTLLLETIVARIADMCEAIAADLNEISHRLFIDDRASRKSPSRAELDLQAIIRRLGRKRTVIAMLRETMISHTRAITFLRAVAPAHLSRDAVERLRRVERDLKSLMDYEIQFADDTGYLQEATLGLISLDQNRIIKVFSIAAVLFLPPTLVGTVYGMNFEAMPELKWAYGYPVAITLMLLSALGPYFWFKQRGWL